MFGTRNRGGRIESPLPGPPEFVTLGPGLIALGTRTPQYLVIDIDDSRETWRALLRTIETLAAEGRLVDCCRPADRAGARGPSAEI